MYLIGSYYLLAHFGIEDYILKSVLWSHLSDSCSLSVGFFALYLLLSYNDIIWDLALIIFYCLFLGQVSFPELLEEGYPGLPVQIEANDSGFPCLIIEF